MYDAFTVKVDKTLQDLTGVVHDDFLLLNSAMLQKIFETATIAVLLEDVYLVSMNLNAIVLDDVDVVEHLHD